MTTRHAALLAVPLLSALFAVSGVFAQAPEVTVRDLCKDAIDPYVPGMERMRFLQASGADNELSAEEFIADAGRAGGFAREFDAWDALAKFDKNDNGTIDWFEADAYRRDLRKRMLAAFDKNTDGRLTGEERRAANLALAAGKIPGTATPEPDIVELAPVPGAGSPMPGVAGASAAPGTGEGAERSMRQFADRMRGRIMERFDANQDGEIDEQERAAAQEQMRARFAEMRDRFLVRRFDADGDGQLGEAETASMEQAKEEWRARIESAKARFMEKWDANADGQLEEGEKSAIRESFRARLAERRAAFIAEWDTDGDGELSEAERGAVREQMRARIEEWRQKMDADGDGRVSREEMRAGFRAMRERRTMEAEPGGEQ